MIEYGGIGMWLRGWICRVFGHDAAYGPGIEYLTDLRQIHMYCKRCGAFYSEHDGQKWNMEDDQYSLLSGRKWPNFDR